MVTKIFDKQLKNNLELTGIPTAPTASPETNNNQIATTAYVDAGLGLKTDIDPIITYTHTANKEAHCTAVDIDTNIFTSDAHSLVDGDMVWPIANADAGKIIPLNIYPGGIIYKGHPGYYVGVVDANSFKLYSDAARTTEVDITANINMDLTKMHFETTTEKIDFVSLSNKKYKIKINGKILRNDANGGGIGVNTNNAPENYMGATSMGYSYCYIGGGDVFYDGEFDFDSTGVLTVRNRQYSVKTDSTTVITATSWDRSYFNPLIIGVNITKILFQGAYFANGTRIEVYKL